MLGDRFIETRNTSTYPPQEKNPRVKSTRIAASSATTLPGSCSCSGSFTSGFVNTYVAQPDSRPLVFTSEAIENIPQGWRARETYRLDGDDLVEVFELAEPGKDFTVYSETRLRRAAGR